MKIKQINLPSGSAGLVRYFEDEKNAIKISPEHIVIAISAVIILEILMKRMLTF